ncbi:hypothetical protein [Streptomyces mirabilis]
MGQQIEIRGFGDETEQPDRRPAEVLIVANGAGQEDFARGGWIFLREYVERR